MNKYMIAFQKVVIDQFGRIIPKEKREYVSALKELVLKATPKKVINKQQFNINAGFSDDLELTIDVCYCPTCQKGLYKFGTHCYHCGQALDWSEEE